MLLVWLLLFSVLPSLSFACGKRWPKLILLSDFEWIRELKQPGAHLENFSVDTFINQESPWRWKRIDQRCINEPHVQLQKELNGDWIIILNINYQPNQLKIKSRTNQMQLQKGGIWLKAIPLQPLLGLQALQQGGSHHQWPLVSPKT